MSSVQQDRCGRSKARAWIITAIACLAAAIWQWVELSDRLTQLFWLAFKFGIEPRLLTAGAFMVVVFFFGTSISLGLAIVATRQLRRADSHFRFCSVLSVLMLATGALVWGGLLASPLIQIVSR